mmetsp:Transcript_19449/g.49046  ORF Transcript_19449/g.49046 Transcript_19449/m.49046 type:complete len:375 (+) Transcript_19449:260-1384(+)
MAKGPRRQGHMPVEASEAGAVLVQDGGDSAAPLLPQAWPRAVRIRRDRPVLARRAGSARRRRAQDFRGRIPPHRHQDGVNPIDGKALQNLGNLGQAVRRPIAVPQREQNLRCVLDHAGMLRLGDDGRAHDAVGQRRTDNGAALGDRGAPAMLGDEDDQAQDPGAALQQLDAALMPGSRRTARQAVLVHAPTWRLTKRSVEATLQHLCKRGASVPRLRLPARLRRVRWAHAAVQHVDDMLQPLRLLQQRPGDTLRRGARSGPPQHVTLAAARPCLAAGRPELREQAGAARGDADVPDPLALARRCAPVVDGQELRGQKVAAGVQGHGGDQGQQALAARAIGDLGEVAHKHGIQQELANLREHLDVGARQRHQHRF